LDADVTLCGTVEHHRNELKHFGRIATCFGKVPPPQLRNQPSCDSQLIAIVRKFFANAGNVHANATRK